MTHMRNNSQPRILIADDQADVLMALKLLLKGEGFAIEPEDHVFAGLDEALGAFDAEIGDADMVFNRIVVG